MKQYKSFAELKDLAKECLTGRYGNAVAVTLLPSLITLCVSTMFATTSAFFTMGTTGAAGLQSMPETGLVSAVVSVLFSSLLSVFTGIFNTGIALFFLNLACGRRAETKQFLYGFQYMLKQSIGISAVLALVNLVCLGPFKVCYSLYAANPSEQWMLRTATALIIGGLIYLPLTLGLSQSYFLLLDFPKHSAPEILRMSFKVMKGRKMRLFLLELSFLPLILLGILSFGLGDLWITPFLNMTLALFFLDIMKPAAKEN